MYYNDIILILILTDCLFVSSFDDVSCLDKSEKNSRHCQEAAKLHIVKRLRKYTLSRGCETTHCQEAAKLHIVKKLPNYTLSRGCNTTHCQEAAKSNKMTLTLIK